LRVTEDLFVRHAVFDDAEGIARAHTISWQSAYRGILSDEYLDGLRWETRYEMWSGRLSNVSPTTNNLFVATNTGGTVLGFASIGTVRDKDLVSQEVYEIYAIYVVPESWSLGVGKALIDVALASVPARTSGVSLWVLTDNERGRSFYERQGFKHDGTNRIELIGGQDLEEMRYLRAN
jgi:ribosomal protein S18 acetylase RimI-like enzyme